MSDWKDKANRRISELCRESWYTMNHDRRGRRYKRHRPYSVPAEATALVECIERNDEESAKAIFVHGYNGVVASGK